MRSRSCGDAMREEQGFDDLGRADEHEPEVISLAHQLDRSRHVYLRAAIAAHCVNCDCERCCQAPRGRLR